MADLACFISSAGTTNLQIATVDCDGWSPTVTKPTWVTATTSATDVKISVATKTDTGNREGTITISYTAGGQSCSKTCDITQIGKPSTPGSCKINISIKNSKGSAIYFSVVELHYSTSSHQIPFNCTAIANGSTHLQENVQYDGYCGWEIYNVEVTYATGSCSSQPTVRMLNSDEYWFSNDSRMDEGETLYINIKS